MSQRPPGKHRPRPRWTRGLVFLVLGTSFFALALQSAIEDFEIAGQLLSGTSYQGLVAALGGRIQPTENGTVLATVDVVSLAMPVVLFTAAAWVVGGLLIGLRSGRPHGAALADWAYFGWPWWMIPGIWELARVAALASGLTTLPLFLSAAFGLVYSISFSGWLATFLTLSRATTQVAREPGLTVGPAPATPASMEAPSSTSRRSIPPVVWVAVALYVVAFTGMNWQLYRGLLVPHGDSAMYEEHLWNLEHGKGFRSYLDRGLFLGEHIQVIHVLLVPLHLLWPSLMLMESCQSLALASGAFPVFWMARRHTGCAKSASLLAVAYLLYFPLHFLDVSIDFKTFRPGSFGVPALLFALDQVERRRYGTCSLLLLLLVLSAQEDFAIVIAPLGLWMAFRPERRPLNGKTQSALTILSQWFGLGLAVFATAYFFLVVTVVLPWFRGGAEIHYVGYLGKYGNTAGEVIKNLLTDPRVWASDLLNAHTLMYALSFVAPLGFMPLLSPGRLAAGFPLFVLLCLNQLTRNDAYPWHHFHAPLVPIVFWAAAAGLGNVPLCCSRLHRCRDEPASPPASARAPIWAARFVWTSALATGMLVSMGPLGRNFWDPGSDHYWRKLYVPGKRAEMFARIEGTIPQASRVASTDFVHPRFTHHDRSYDYSEFPRAVNDSKPGAPPDTDYIVIDTQHRYSEIERPEQIPEFRDRPHEWELLPDTTDGYFIVLRRKAGKSELIP